PEVLGHAPGLEEAVLGGDGDQAGYLGQVGQVTIGHAAEELMTGQGRYRDCGHVATSPGNRDRRPGCLPRPPAACHPPRHRAGWPMAEVTPGLAVGPV